MKVVENNSENEDIGDTVGTGESTDTEQEHDSVMMVAENVEITPKDMEDFSQTSIMVQEENNVLLEGDDVEMCIGISSLLGGKRKSGKIKSYSYAYESNRLIILDLENKECALMETEESIEQEGTDDIRAASSSTITEQENSVVTSNDKEVVDQTLGDMEEPYEGSDVDRDYVPHETDESDDYDSSDQDVHMYVGKPNLSQPKAKTVKQPKPALPTVTQAVGEQRSANNSMKRNKSGFYTREKRRNRKRRRNTGQAYLTATGKERGARVMKKLPNCRMKCSQRIPENIRAEIFKEYWSLGDRNKRVSYVASLTNTTGTATTRKRTDDPQKQKSRALTHIFHFKVNGERIRVCRGCFMKTLDETQMFVTLAVSNANTSTSGITYEDKRGVSAPANKHSSKAIEEVIAHIKSFPSYKSHYTRRENDKKYLPSHLTLQIMYELYCENRDEVVSRRIYENEFHKLKLAFKKPKIDTCHKCDVLKMRLQVADNEGKPPIEEEIDRHHSEADDAYLRKDSDKTLAKQDSSIRVYTFDLQQCLATPFVNSSVSFYKRQLWTYNLTIHDLGTGGVTCYMWHEAEGGRGGNQIATCIFTELVSLPPDVKKVILYSDTCGGQNKNSHVAAMYMTVMQRNKNLEIIDHKFMVSGHSHMECDVDHALIEKQKKKLQMQISHPHDWYQLVRSTGKKNKFIVKELTYDMFLNFSDLYKKALVLRKKDSNGDPFKWHDQRWFRYTKQTGKLLFKSSLDEEQPFTEISFNRRGNSSPDLFPVKCYRSTLPISADKKANLLELLPLISPTFHDFYRNLKTSDDAENDYPDIVEFDEDLAA